MKVRFVDPTRHYVSHKEEYLAAVDDVLSRGDLIARGDLERFERDFASFLGVKHVVGLNSGTDALIFGLIAAGVGPGDEVITVSHTFVASVAAIAHVGAIPVLVDVKEDFLIDVDQIEKVVTPRTKAVIPVHLNGRVCDMERIMALATKHKIAVIEDAAQAIGAVFEGKKAGTFGLAGAFSLYPFKILGAYGDGGALATDNKEVASLAMLLRDHGQKTRTELVRYGFNSRLDNLQAAILNVHMKYLPSWLRRRHETASRYHEGLNGISQVRIPRFSDPRRTDVYQNYVLKAEERDELSTFLKERGVETLVKDPVALHHHPGLGLSRFSLPYSEELAKKVISLPCYPDITDQETKYVITQVREFYHGREKV